MLKRPLASREPAVDPLDADRSALVLRPGDPVRNRLLERVGGSKVADPPSPAEEALANAVIADPVLAQVAGEVRGDPDAIALLIHGSRAIGLAGPDSNYDFITIVRDAVYHERSVRGTLTERRFRSELPTIEITYESLGRLRRIAQRGGSRAKMFASATVLVDKSGEITPLVSATLAGGEPPYERVIGEYDGYLNGFAHSLKSSSRGDDLGARAHAAQSGLHLVKALFALEGKSAPYLDQLTLRLSELDEAQGWRAGFLHGALLRLLYAPDPPFQQMLDRRVSRLMDSRGIRHQWRHDLELVRRVRYDEL